MRTAILALILSIPVSLTADFIGMAMSDANAESLPCTAPASSAPAIMPPKAEGGPVKRPPRRFLRAA